MRTLALVMGLWAVGCTVDPDAILTEADLTVAFINTQEEATRVDATLVRLDREPTLRQATLSAGSATLYFFGLPEGEFELSVIVRDAAGEPLQCLTQPLTHANRRQSITIDVNEFAEPCEDEPPECDEEPCEE